MIINCWTLLIFTFFINFELSSSSIRPSSKLSLTDAQGFIAYLYVPEEFGSLKSCHFQYGANEEITELNLTSNIDTGIQTPRNETVFRHSKTVCGIRVEKLSSASEGVWTLTAKNATDNSVVDSVSISILPAWNLIRETNITLPIGKSTVSCEQLTATRSCFISNEFNETWPICEAYVNIRGPSEFECKTMNWGIMEETKETIRVEMGARNKRIESTMVENDESFILTCHNMDTIYHCRAIHPDNKTHFLIMDGLNNGKYSAYDTRLSEGKCTLEIRKPIETSQIGLWKILPGEHNLQKGCLFYVGVDKQTQIQEELRKMTTLNTIEMLPLPSHTLDIKCEVPFALDKCYLNDPNNQLYFPDNLQFEQSKNLGLCIFKNVSKLVGRWICGLSGLDHEEIYLQNFEVVMGSTTGRSVEPNVRAAKGRTCELMCESAGREPISDCAFIDPSGNVHILSNMSKSNQNNNIQYFGKGIEYGYCGATIKSLGNDDIGTWSCQFRVYTSNRVASFEILVEKQPLGAAAISGIAVGVGALVLIGTIGGLFLYKRRKRSQEDGNSEEINLDDAN